MRVFVTGATGFIGSAIVQELRAAGHEVLGLARSDAAVETLSRLGIEAHRGALSDPESLAAGARACDGVIHTAFIHDFSKFKDSCETDRQVIEALGEALAGSDRPLIVTSGIALLAGGHLATEDREPAFGTGAIPRVASEEAALSVAARGGNVSVLRLPPSVHGDGDHGFVPMLIEVARQKGVSAYPGDGLNRWPAVHRLDAARLYRLVLENGAAGGRYHAVADEGVAFKDIAATIGRQLDVPVVSQTAQDAAGHFGWLAHFVTLDVPASSTRTREQTGWRPTLPGLIADLDQGRYFDA